ncbi:MAG TPA: RHS repeat-associated core domain-containing protein [Baekduia sp.]
MIGAVAAFAVALFVGSPSRADDGAGPTAPARPRVQAPPSGADIASLRTADSRTYRGAGGAYRTVVSSTPVNFQDASGAWQAIDTRLKTDGGGGLQTTAAATEVALPGGLDDPAKVTSGARWVSFALRNAAAVAPRAAGATATYADVLDGVDATYEAQPAGVKETLTLADPDAPSTYRFALAASTGLVPSLRDDGSVVFRGPQGTIRFWLPAPTVQAADQAAASAQHVAYRLSDDGQSLSVVVDPAWLAKASFPVKVDPTIYDGASMTACTLASGSLASTSDCSSSLLKIGNDGSHVLRTALRFNGLAAANLPTGAAIDYAELGLFSEGMTHVAVHPQIDVAGLTHTVATGAAWNGYDTVHAWTTPGGDTSATPDVRPLVWGTFFDGHVGEPLGWDVSALVQSWLRDPSTNHGVLLRAHDETALNVLSADSPTAATQGPWLQIDWRWRPGTERDQSYQSVGIDDRSGLNVNVVSGNLAMQSSDVHLPGVAGMDLNFSRAYNSGDLSDDHLTGSAWSPEVNGAGLDLRTHFLSNGHTLYASGGAVYRFDRNPTADSGTTLAFITPSGIDATMTQDSATAVTTVTFRDGTVWTYTDGNFDSQQLTRIADRHGNHIDLAYDSARGDDGRALDTITDTYGHVLTVTRDSGGMVTGLTDAASRHWAYAKNASVNDRLDSATDPDSHTTSYDYVTGIPALSDLIDQITDPDGHVIRVVYAAGTSYRVSRLTRVVDGTSDNDLTWSFDYAPTLGTGDPCTAADVIGRTVETDPRGKPTTYCYNADGQIIQTIDGNHRSVEASYTASGNVSDFTGLAGTGNPSLSTYGFSSIGNATGSSTTIGAGNTQSSTIKYCGDASQPACSGTAGSLDKYRPTLATDSQGTSQAFGYTTAGDVNDITTASGSDHQSLTYDAAGNVLTSTDGNTHQTTYHYTGNFLDSVTPPSPLAPETFTPDSLKRVHTATDGNGQTTTATYDGEDRVTRIDYSPSGAWMTFTYDANGNVTQRADSSGHTTTYGYDTLNRRTSETFPGSRTNTYVYDKASNLTSITDADGVTSYTYDDANRLASVTSPKPGGGTDAITYTYTDPATSTAPSAQTTSYPGGLQQVATSDAAGNILSIKILNSAGTVLKSRTYDHGLSASATSAMIQSVTDEAGATTSYTYGAADRLAEADTPSGDYFYVYDAAGNRLSWHIAGPSGVHGPTFTYNAANELCWSYGGPSSNTCANPPAGATLFTYDAGGQRTNGATYDALQRLTAFGSDALSYLSPGNGELVSYGATGYQNSILGLSRQIPSSGSATDIIRQPNGAPIAQRVGTTNKQELFSDALGSTIAMADDGANALGRHYTYDPNGNVTTTGTGATTNLLLAGGQQLPNADYHFGARFFDPTTGTWTQQDPINQIGSLTQANRYSYAAGNPFQFADPTGASVVSWLTDKAKKAAAPYCVAKAVYKVWQERDDLNYDQQGQAGYGSSVDYALRHELAPCVPDVGDYINDALALFNKQG